MCKFAIIMMDTSTPPKNMNQNEMKWSLSNLIWKKKANTISVLISEIEDSTQKILDIDTHRSVGFWVEVTEKIPNLLEEETDETRKIGLWLIANPVNTMQ